jgi:hypothetical protein
MTITVTLPTTPQPYLERGLLPADFYSYEELLSDSEREKVARIREFFRTEAAPIVEDYWARAEFPHELVKGFAKLGLLDWADPDSSEPAPSNLMTGITALEMAHADPSLSVFFGVHSVSKRFGWSPGRRVAAHPAPESPHRDGLHNHEARLHVTCHDRLRRRNRFSMATHRYQPADTHERGTLPLDRHGQRPDLPDVVAVLDDCAI